MDHNIPTLVHFKNHMYIPDVLRNLQPVRHSFIKSDSELCGAHSLSKSLNQLHVPSLHPPSLLTFPFSLPFPPPFSSLPCSLLSFSCPFFPSLSSSSPLFFLPFPPLPPSLPHIHLCISHFRMRVQLWKE